NWMTAGKCVGHSERTPEYLRNSELELHAMQIRGALPKELEFTNPQFSHVEEDQLRIWTRHHVDFTFITGAVPGHHSSATAHSALYMVEIQSDHRLTLNIGNELYG